MGVDCSTEAFPQGLCGKPGSPIYGCLEGGVESITIIFTLDQDYSELGLRLRRAGDDTTAITVDGQQTHLVTNAMLGSSENYVVGGYELMLGALSKGDHSIQLTVADDGRGDGGFIWDALTLFAK